MAKKILIVGAGTAVKYASLLAKFKKQYGNDVILVTPKEVKEQGLELKDIANIPTIKIKMTDPPIIPMMVLGDYKTGKEKRRERREKERKLNKCKG